MLFVSSTKYPEGKLPYHIVVLFLIFQGTSTPLDYTSLHSYPQCKRVPFFFISLTTLVVCYLFDGSYSENVRWCLITVLIWIPLMIHGDYTFLITMQTQSRFYFLSLFGAFLHLPGSHTTGQCFLSFIVPMKHLGIFLRYRFWSLGLGWGWEFLHTSSLVVPILRAYFLICKLRR